MTVDRPATMRPLPLPALRAFILLLIFALPATALGQDSPPPAASAPAAPAAPSASAPVPAAAVSAPAAPSASVPVPAAAPAAGKSAAELAYERGFALQLEMRTIEAIEAYKEALLLNPFHGKANYEIGWSYWVLRDWEKVVRHWEVAGQLEAGTPELPDFLEVARERMEGKTPPLVRVAIGTRAEAGEGRALSLELVARFQHYDPKPEHPADRFDRHVFSPKSVKFAPDGQRVYVNALEGKSTLVYDPATLRKKRVIIHRFGEAEAALFDAKGEEERWKALPPGLAPEQRQRFEGKPVEAAFSHGGRYLWISYYRRDFDKLGRMPSAVAVVDTRGDRIVRVLATGPIPKSLAYSPAAGLMAVVHWGDNSVGFIDARGAEPSAFKLAGEIVVGRRLPLDIEGKIDRDHYCGYCLRGGVFTPDGRYFLLGRMGGGGIAVLDVAARSHLGTVWGMKPTPRHLLLSADGSRLYAGSSASGYVSLYQTAELIKAAKNGRRSLPPLHQTRTGSGTRTIALSPDGTRLYAVVNNESKIVALDAANLQIILEIPVDSFPVGLDVSPDGKQLWTTSQGRKLRGGNSISIYKIESE